MTDKPRPSSEQEQNTPEESDPLDTTLVSDALSDAFADDPFFSHDMDLLDEPEPSTEEGASTDQILPVTVPPPTDRPRYQPPDRLVRRSSPSSSVSAPAPTPDDLDEPVELDSDTDESAVMVQDRARRGLARWRQRARQAEGRITVDQLPVPVVDPLPDEPRPVEVTRTERVDFEVLGLADDELPETNTADLASLGEIDLMDIDRVLADLEGDVVSLAGDEVDPYEASGLFVVGTSSSVSAVNALPEFTARLRARLPGLDEDLQLPVPWGQYVAELRGEILACKNPHLRASYIHEAADVLRLTGDRWREVAYELDGRALDLNPLYMPALRARLVECWINGDREAYEAALVDAVGQAANAAAVSDAGPPPMLSTLHFELGVVREERGDVVGALEHYQLAARVGGPDPYYALNVGRLCVASRDVEGYRRACLSVAAQMGDGPAVSALRAAVLLDAATVMRGAGLTDLATPLARAALESDPRLIAATRTLQLLGWESSDPSLEVDGLRAQLAAMVEVGTRIERGSARRKYIKRRAAARFHRLGSLLTRMGRPEEAVKAFGDALGVRPNELVYLRASERAARGVGDWAKVDESLTRMAGLVVDPARLSLVLVGQARCRLNLGDQGGAKTHFVRALEIASDCLPARIELERLLMAAGEVEGLLGLWPDGLFDEGSEDSVRLAASMAWRRGEIHEYLLMNSTAASEAYGRAVKLVPKGGPWLASAERALIQAGDDAGLTQFYRDIIPGAPRERRAKYKLRAGLHARMAGKLDAATEYYRDLFGHDELDVADSEDFTTLLIEQRLDDEASAALVTLIDQCEARLAVEVEDSSGTVRAVLCRSLARLVQLRSDSGDSEGALEASAALLRYRPGDPQVLQARRTFVEEAGDLQGLLNLLVEQANSTASPGRRRELSMEAAELCLYRIRDRRRGIALLEGIVREFPQYQEAAELLISSLRDREMWAELAPQLATRAYVVGRHDQAEGVRHAFEAALVYRDRLGDDARALDAFNHVLMLAPDFEPGLRGVADTAHRLGRYKELADHLEKWSRLPAPPSRRASILRKLAYVLEFHLDEPRAALERHQALLDAEPNDLVSLVAVARIANELGEQVALIDVWRRLSSVVPEVEDKVGYLLRAARTSEAMALDPAQDYRRILELQPGLPTAQRGLERALIEAEDYGDLLNLYLEYAKAAQGAHRSHHLVKIANVYEQIGRLEDAQEILKKIVALEPLHVAARFMLARIARANGDFELAALMSVELAQTAPTDEEKLLHLSSAAILYQGELAAPHLAEPLLKEILAISPGAEGAYEDLRAYYSTSEADESRSGLLDVIDSKLEVADSTQRGELLKEAAHLAEGVDRSRALEYIDEILTEDGGDMEALSLAVNLAEGDGRYSDAADYLTRQLDVLEADPDRHAYARSDVLLRLGRIELEQLDDPLSAVDHLGQLRRESGDNLEAIRLLARGCLQNGDVEGAVALFKDLFEREASPELSLQIAELLSQRLNRRQEALAWYQRALDLNPTGGAALEGFLLLSNELETVSSQMVNARVLRDRLDWLADEHLESLAQDPWRVDLLVQLAKLSRLRNDRERTRDLAGILTYFGAADPELLAYHRDTPPGRADLLVSGQSTAALAEADIRELLIPLAGRGLRRRVFSMLAPVVAEVDSDSLKSRGVVRTDRLVDTGTRLEEQIGSLCTVLGIYGVEVYLHPTDQYSVSALFVPEPILLVGRAVFEDPTDPFHQFRVVRALESLRDGKGLVARRGAPKMLASLDEMLGDAFSGSPVLPLFSSHRYATEWVSDGPRRLQRAMTRRIKKDLRPLMNARGPLAGGPLPPLEGWIEACAVVPVRMGLAVCGEFGVAADAVAGKTFSLDRKAGPDRQREVLGALRESAAAGLIEEMLRFIVSEPYSTLRRRLGLFAGSGDRS